MRDRLLILLNSDVIDQNTYDNCIKVYEELIVKRGYQDDEASVFITHLAMMIQRNKNGEIVNQMEGFILDEIKSVPNFEKVKEFAQKVYELVEFEIPETEKDYVLLHLNNFVK